MLPIVNPAQPKRRGRETNVNPISRLAAACEKRRAGYNADCSRRRTRQVSLAIFSHPVSCSFEQECPATATSCANELIRLVLLVGPFVRRTLQTCIKHVHDRLLMQRMTYPGGPIQVEENNALFVVGLVESKMVVM